MFDVKRLLSTMMILLLLCSALLLAQPAPAQAASYNDISRHWARDAITRWASLGALEDFPGGAFRPDAPINRAEFFSILVHALGATEMADISYFTDVPEDAWYHDVVAKAAQMRIATGVSQTTMRPLENIIRQDAATIVARAMGLSGENANYLYRYNDRDNISNYAGNFVSSITEHGYMAGSYGNFNPRAYLSRAEAVKIIDNLFTHYYRPEVGFDSLTLNGNVMTIRTDSVFNNLTIDGDLILADAVGQGSVTLNNCVISGRLLIRGGGSSSIVLNNTRVGGGITVISPSSIPRVVSNGTTSVPQLNAYSSFILSGTGVHAATILDDAFYNTIATLEGVMLSTMYAGGVGNEVDLREGRITNFHVGGAADNTTCTLANGSLVDYFSTVAPYTTVNGSGNISDAFIGAPGATLAMTPFVYTVGANLSATVAGKTAAGKVLTTTNNVGRNSLALSVSPNSDRTGGEDIRIDSSQGRSSNTVLVTQTPYSKVLLENVNGRLGYYIGFFIPVPANRGNNRVEMLNYINSDGGLVTMEDVSLVRKNGVYGLEFHIPVTRMGSELRGQLKETMFIQWDNINTENLQFHSGWLDLEPLTSSQENRLLEQYEEQRFRGYDGTRYTGAEALQRLLASDNALGLDVKNFGSFSTADQEALAARLLELSSAFDSKTTVQNLVNQVVIGKAALFSVNNAVTTAQLRYAFENVDFAKEMNIEVTGGTLYGLLSNAGKQRVATVVLTGRAKDFADPAAAKTAFDKAVADIRAIENNMLVGLNAARFAADALKLVETKNNAALLDFYPSEEPYKSYPAALKLEMGQRLLDNKPYYSADAVKQVIQDFLITAAESGAGPAVSITAIKAEPATINLVPGRSEIFTIIVTTSTGTLINPQGVVLTNSAPTIVDLDESTHTVTAKIPGSAKITASITDTETKKVFTATITVTVKAPVPSTSVKLNRDYIEIGEGTSDSILIATMTPANTTDTLTWTSLDTSIVTVDGGRLTGVAPGSATVGVITTSNQSAFCQVVVVSKDPGVMIIPDTATIGISQSVDLKAIVSPITLPNRDKVLWRSEDSSIATVNPAGKVTGVSVDKVKITATYNGGGATSVPPGEAIITVSSDIRSLRLNTYKIVMVPTGIEKITPTILPQGSTDVVLWDIIGDDTIASVDQNGLVTGYSPGKVQVMAYLQDYSAAMAICDVEVLSATLNITATVTPNRLYVGETGKLNVTFNPNTITNKNITWSSNKPNVATITGTTVNAIGTGMDGNKLIESIVANIVGIPEAKANTEVIAPVTVVHKMVTSFTAVPDHLYLTAGNSGFVSQFFTITLKPDDATYKIIDWVSNDPDKLEVISPTIGESGTDPYGSQRILAKKTTFEPGVDANGNPITIDKPVILTGTALGADSKVKEVKLQVSIYSTSGSGQISNVKINMDRWVYGVGETQNLSVLFNITGRNQNTGVWRVSANQPANQKVTWKTDPVGIARVDGNGQLTALAPGKTILTVTTDDGGVTDTVTIIVAPKNALAISGLDNDPAYPSHIKVEVGKPRTITTNNQAIYIPYLWKYGDNDNTGSPDGVDSSVVGPITNGELNAKKSGLVNVTVRPVDPTYVDTKSINELQAMCLDMGVSFTDFLAKNGIVQNGGDYYSPNEINLSIQGYTIPKMTLDQNKLYSLVVPQTDKKFFVWATYQPLLGIAFSPLQSNTHAKGDTFTLTAVVNPTAYTGLTAADIIWTVDNKLTLQSQSFDAATGICTATFRVKPNTATGDSIVTVTATTKAENGLKSTITGYPQQAKPVATKTDSFTVKVVDVVPLIAPLRINVPVEQSAAVEQQLAAQLAQPVQQSAEQPTQQPVQQPVEQPTQQPVEQPIEQPIEQIAAPQPAYMETPSYENALPTTSSKILKLRGSAIVALGQAIRLSPMLSPGNYDLAGLAWISSKPDIATVDGNGVVTGLKAGRTAITVTIPGTKLKAICNVTVAATLKVPLAGLSLSNSTLTLVEGKAAALKATFAPANATAKGLSWFSSDSSIATVDVAGKVTAIAAGSATITAVADDGGRMATCTVTVTPKPIRVTGVTLNQKALSLLVGDQYTLEYAIAPADAANQDVRWTTSNSNVATVDSNGNITALKKGSATITVITSDGSKRATCKVTVK